MKNNLETFPESLGVFGEGRYTEWKKDFEEELETHCNPKDCGIYPPYNMQVCKNWCEHKLTPKEILGDG